MTGGERFPRHICADMPALFTRGVIARYGSEELPIDMLLTLTVDNTPRCYQIHVNIITTR